VFNEKNILILDQQEYEYTLDDPNSNKIIFENHEGKEAIIDFGSKEITYTGDLPVEESAKIFFEVFGNLVKSDCDKDKEDI
jgi:hypothetical protein